jgi:FkbM family methyltransferase
MSKLSAFNTIRRFPPAYDAAMSIYDLYSWARCKKHGSYSQHGEDAFVAKFFAGRNKVFYVDIGASHPFKLSNTYLLYRAGNRGVTVEPIPRLGRLHRRWRPRDTLLPVGVGVSAGELEFFELTPSVLSTLDRVVASQYVSEGRAVLFRSYKIPILPINEVMERATNIETIDLLSIDIEGLDAEVLAGIDYSRFRPHLIVAEVNSREALDKTEALFERADYKIIKSLGCNLVATPN